MKSAKNFTLCTKLILKNHLIEIFHQNQKTIKTQRSSKSKDSNPKSSISSKSRKSSNSSESHSSSKSSESSINSRSETLLLEKQKASVLASQTEEKFERQIRLTEMKKELEIKTKKEKALNEVIEARNKKQNQFQQINPVASRPIQDRQLCH